MSGTASPRRDRADGRAAVLLVAVAACAAFAASLSGSFVWDDHRFITENASVREPRSWLRFLTDAATVDETGSGGIVRPLRTLEFALDWALGGGAPAVFRVHSLAWHAAAAALLLLVLRRLLGNARASLAGALVFAVHPVQTESVALISSRGDVAMGACVLASVLFALRSEGGGRNLAISLAAAAVATLYKETAVALPAVVAALRWTKLVRVPVWPYVLVAALYWFVYRRAVQVGETGHGATFVLGGSTQGTFATMIRAFGFYAAVTVLPVEAFDWFMTPSTSFADGAVIAWLAAHSTLAVSAVAARRRSPVWTLGVAWFYAFLLPVANWPVFLGIAVDERFLYVSVAGAAIAAGWALARAPRGAGIAAFAIVAALFGASVVRSRMWTSDEALWAAVRAGHESPRDRQHRAMAARNEALALRDRAMAMPEGPARTGSLARVKALLEESLDHAHRALDQWYAFELVRRSRSEITRRSEITASNVCYVLGRDAEALFHAEEAVRIGESLDAYGHFDRAMPLLALGYAPQAMASMRRARALGMSKPDAEIGGFFRDAAAACEGAGLLAAAEAGYETAAEASPEGPLRRDAQVRLAALRRRPRPEGAAADERSQLAALDEALARLPRSCPARRDHSRPK